MHSQCFSGYKIRQEYITGWFPTSRYLFEFALKSLFFIRTYKTISQVGSQQCLIEFTWTSFFIRTYKNISQVSFQQYLIEFAWTSFFCKNIQKYITGWFPTIPNRIYLDKMFLNCYNTTLYTDKEKL